ncbi:heavy metal translocating P-type ATPase [Rhizobium sp. PDO1-076]|uniref:heavy metal translocating P-type ATPase n=1 Tax=Rhizobium sp. PDO1-076 TaxID=1125979 RepID=UPI00024E3778|nr:heavy metal translocating P-type ATPase [Rhizobium sp. PDO1-076]EHS52094.1 heavy metal translocating P-type ATPase [Rhizobium sp. PDO1-076]
MLRLREMAPALLAGFALLGLALGGLSYALGRPDLASSAWLVSGLVVLIALLTEIVRSVLSGKVGVDAIAALSIGVALLLGETLAGAIVAMMYAGGQQLESFAEGRARRDMTALLGRVARTAMVYRGADLASVPIEALKPGDRALMRSGEVIPVDGRVLAGAIELDLSALTGEPLPVRFLQGAEVPSGATVVGAPFDLLVLRDSAASTYAGIVRLVENAQKSRAPMVRLADRYALAFLAFTLALAGLAYGFSQDATRALAVLVVATPCPLILAVPVAVISGMSRAAAHGVLIKSGGGLEALAAVKVVVLDKTGTLTAGRPEVSEIRCCPGFVADDILRLAASLDQASGHVTAEALVRAAVARGLHLDLPEDIHEIAGFGIEGLVTGHRVAVGGGGFVASRLAPGELLPRQVVPAETAVVAVAIDGRGAGHILLSDQVRADAGQTVAAFRKVGITRLVMASGDRSDIVTAAAARLGLDGAHGDLSPERKVAVIEAERQHGSVMMVGDGVNDAPALAVADVGVAIGARGSAASSETADVVLLVDDLSRLPVAVAIARRARFIAVQSAVAGLVLSGGAMIAAALGYLAPVQGALLQEVIDVAVILNALRALRSAG